MTTFSPACLRRRRSGTVSFLRSSGTKLGLLGALVERFHLPADGVGMRGERALVEIGLRPRLVVEMMMAIDTADQRRRVAHLGLAHVGRDVADGEADPPYVRAVGL